ncbi:MAG TPA: hypothetical protein VN495_00970 [Candidatus Paceibacterota bacterium]|nr:hypothetical protein [Candidatus Paceibacterota bacterium]
MKRARIVMSEKPLLFSDTKEKTGFVIGYTPQPDGSVLLEARETDTAISARFSPDKIDEAHILYMEATELLSSRAKINQAPAEIRKSAEKLFAAFRGEKNVAEKMEVKPVPVQTEFVPNPGKKIEIDVDGVRFSRLPVRTRLITMDDTDILPLIEEYAKPHLQPGDLLFVSEKALCIAQGRVVDMSDIHPGKIARLFARNVGNNYGAKDFKGFGHGTAIAMQLLIEEAGYPRALFAGVVAALTRPFGIRGAFYYLCGKQAKSIDCPMSFLILEYAHAVKLAPRNPSGEARRIKAALGCETIILDANYRGAFSLGKSSRAVSERFAQKLFRDNPLGQSDEMTPFCIVRKAV